MIRARAFQLPARPLEAGVGVHEDVEHEGDLLGDAFIFAVGLAVNFRVVVERRLQVGVGREGDLGGFPVRQGSEFEGHLIAPGSR